MDKKVKALLVEDNLIAQKIASMVLIEIGCDVDVAGDGKSALELFENNHYGIIFMDIGLPDMDGFSVTKKIREFEKGHVTIIGLSAHGEENYKKQAAAAGMDDYMVKPLLAESAKKWLRVANSI